MAVKQEINVGLVAFIGVIGGMLLLISVWGVEAWYAYEVDLLSEERYDADRNIEWLDLKAEQYANIGDRVGNSTIYAAGPDPREGELPPAWGYRYQGDDQQSAAVPIHLAMARIIAEYGNASVTAEEMQQVDRTHAAVVNEAYADFMTPTEYEPQDAPEPAPQEESAAGEGRSSQPPPATPPTTGPATPPAGGAR